MLSFPMGTPSIKCESEGEGQVSCLAYSCYKQAVDYPSTRYTVKPVGKVASQLCILYKLKEECMATII